MLTSATKRKAAMLPCRNVDCESGTWRYPVGDFGDRTFAMRATESAAPVENSGSRTAETPCLNAEAYGLHRSKLRRVRWNQLPATIVGTVHSSCRAPTETRREGCLPASYGFGAGFRAAR